MPLTAQFQPHRDILATGIEGSAEGADRCTMTLVNGVSRLTHAAGYNNPTSG